MSNIDPKMLEDIVKKIVMQTFSQEQTANNDRTIDKSGIMSVKLPTIKLGEADRFDTGKAGDCVLLRDVLSLEESPRLGCGLMEMDKTTFDWTLEYDEIDYVIEGRLEINIDGRKICADKGEIILIPKGSKIQFCVPEYAKFMYVTYPANWAEQA